jgi:hypothetical protein
VGYEFARRGRAKEAERALEEACLARFGTLRPTGAVYDLVRIRNIWPRRRNEPAGCAGTSAPPFEAASDTAPIRVRSR